MEKNIAICVSSFFKYIFRIYKVFLKQFFHHKFNGFRLNFAQLRTASANLEKKEINFFLWKFWFDFDAQLI